MNNKQILTYVTIAANDIQSLRIQDVYRVLCLAFEHDMHINLANSLKQLRPDLIAEIDDSLNDIVI